MRSRPMLARLFLGVVFCAGVCAIARYGHGSTVTRETRAHGSSIDDGQSIAFEPTTAFTGGRGDFFARTADYDVSLAADRVTFQLRSASARTPPAPMVMTLVSADPLAPLTSAEPLPGKVNYLIGRDRSQWQRNLPTFGRVIERGAWHGIDVAYYGRQDHVETDFVVAAGADAGQIALDFDAAADVSLGDDGELSVSAGNGQTLHFVPPVAYQRLADGSRTDVASHYVLATSHAGTGHRVTLDVAPYDTGRPLVIDPEVLVLDYSTFIGRQARDLISNGVAVDDEGRAFVAGADTTNGRAFIKKYSENGRTLLFTTFLGRGLNVDVFPSTTVAEAIALGPGGEHAYVTGYTQDPRFPTTPGAFEAGNRIWLSGSAFVVKLTNDGSDFVYSTVLIGDGLDLMGFYTVDTMPPDIGRGIAVDQQGHAYVVGTTSHSGWPTTEHALFHGDQPDKDMSFFTKFSSDGTRVLYSTFIGGAGGGSYATGVVVDQDDSIYLTGRTDSPSFPVQHAFQPHLSHKNAIDGFVMKFARLPVSITANGFEPPQVHFAPVLVYSTYLGGGPGFAETDLNGIAVDGQGAMYVAGYTTSVEYPCKHAFQCPFQHNEHSFTVPAAIVTKIHPDGQSLAYSTFLQGPLGGGLTLANGIAVHQGNAYVTGLTDVADFPVHRAFQKELCCGGETGDSVDAFVTKLSDDGASLVWSTFLGGAGDDEGLAIAVDHDGSAYVTGSTTSAAFPLKKPELDQLRGITNGFLTKLHLEAAPGGQH